MEAILTKQALPEWTVGDRLSKARRWSGLTQSAMAARLKIGRRSVVRYEAQEEPPRTIVLAYASATGVPEWWLDGLDSPPDPEKSPITTRYTATLARVA